jgi:hypothetical protein
MPENPDELIDGPALENFEIDASVVFQLGESLITDSIQALMDGLAKEAARYGAAGGKPQVVWPNGTLASVAVGFFMKIVTPWETQKATPLLLEYDGDLQTVTLTPSNKLAYLPAHCKHFVSLDELGDPFWTPDALALPDR